MFLDQRGVIEPHLAQRAGSEVLHQHVALRNEQIENRPSFGLLEVERHAFLVPVDAEKICALAVHERRSPTARVVSFAWLLDLDDPRPHVAEQHGAIRT